jgi:hypothetical protein
METHVCPHCNFESPTSAKFCMNCGEPFQTAQTPPDDRDISKLDAEPEPGAPEAAPKGKQPDWLAQLYREVDEAKSVKDKPAPAGRAAGIVPPLQVPPAPPAAGAPPISLPPSAGSPPAAKAAAKVAGAPQLAPQETPPKAPPKAEGRRTLRLGCIVLVVLLCLGGIATAITGLAFQDEIIALLRPSPTIPVAVEAPTLAPPHTPPAPPTRAHQHPPSPLYPRPHGNPAAFSHANHHPDCYPGSAAHADHLHRLRAR